MKISVFCNTVSGRTRVKEDITLITMTDIGLWWNRMKQDDSLDNRGWHMMTMTDIGMWWNTVNQDDSPDNRGWHMITIDWGKLHRTTVNQNDSGGHRTVWSPWRQLLDWLAVPVHSVLAPVPRRLLDLSTEKRRTWMSSVVLKKFRTSRFNYLPWEISVVVATTLLFLRNIILNDNLKLYF